MPQLIHKAALNNLEYDADYKTPSSTSTMAGATLMVVFSGADLNAAAYHLAKSMSSPFASDAVATVLLQEAVREEFLAKLTPQLKAYDDKVTTQAAFQNALKAIARLKAPIVTGTGIDASKSPTLVCDFLQEQLGNGTTGVVTLHTYRTAKEAIALAAKETLSFAQASIWHENHSCAYELAINLKTTHFFINCFAPSLAPLKDKLSDGSNFVTIANNYHYETLKLNDMQKVIVFPIGTIFAN